MLQKFINNVVISRHPWRSVNFDELSELYVSMMFRSLALSLIGIFVPIYLYNLGNSVQTILLFYAVMFGIRVPGDVIAGQVVARIGPKHTMTMSYITQVIALTMLVTMPTYDWSLWLIACLCGMAGGLFFVAYHVDFSKVKHSKHGGKELGFMVLMERSGTIAGPLVGGLIATFFDVKYSFIAAIVFFAIGAVPMFLSAEPVKTRQHIRYRGIKLPRIKDDLISYSALGIENNVCLVMWPLFIAIFVIGSNVYLKLGILASLGAVMTVLSARAIGRIIDEKRGRSLLRYSLIANVLVHFGRIFVSSFGFALGLNLANEVVTVGYRMPYIKGMYDKADDLPGYRIAYLSIMESMTSGAKSLFFWFMALFSFIATERSLFIVSFFVAMVASLVIMKYEKFPALNPRKRYAR